MLEMAAALGVHILDSFCCSCGTWVMSRHLHVQHLSAMTMRGASTFDLPMPTREAERAASASAAVHTGRGATYQASRSSAHILGSDKREENLQLVLNSLGMKDTRMIDKSR